MLLVLQHPNSEPQISVLSRVRAIAAAHIVSTSNTKRFDGPGLTWSDVRENKQNCKYLWYYYYYYYY